MQWSGTETANSNQLKDGDMREVLTGQGVDRLFLEAEKLGIDTRIRQGDSLAEANADTKMSFQFFGACEDHDQARRGAGIGLDKPDKGSSVVVGRNDEISPTTLHHSGSGSGRGDQSLHQAVSLSLDKGSARLPTFAEVLISAKLFHRVRWVGRMNVKDVLMARDQSDATLSRPLFVTPLNLLLTFSGQLMRFARVGNLRETSSPWTTSGREKR